MKIKICFSLFILVFVGFGYGNNSTFNLKTFKFGDTTKIKPWKFEKISGQTIYFTNGKKVQSNLFDVKYIGQLQTKSKAPYLILSGKTCKECDENTAIFIFSPSDGPMRGHKDQKKYSYPGKEYDYVTKRLVFEARMFYGSCLGDGIPSVIWLQKQLNSNKVFDTNIFIVKVVNDVLVEYSSDDSSINKESLLNCKELPGLEFTSEP